MTTHPLRLYLLILDLLALAFNLPLLCYAEGWISADAYLPVILWTEAACLTLPCLADAVDVSASLLAQCRRAVRMLLGMDIPR